MFDRVNHPARGRDGGGAGAAGAVRLDDGAVLRGKGVQQVPAGRRLILELPGGGGYGAPHLRPRDAIERDLSNGHITVAQAQTDYRRDGEG